MGRPANVGAEQFESELMLITDPKIRAFTRRALELAPEYFWTIPASSSGKYHPMFSQGEGGLVRHVKACVKIAVELLKLDMYGFETAQIDEILSALLLHDTYKQGDGSMKRSVTEHPILAANALYKNDELNNMLPHQQLFAIAGNIMTHMGQWTADHDGKVVLARPETRTQKFVHLCDYLASRRFLEVNFER